MSSSSDRFVIAATFPSAGAAHLARAQLEANGINAMVSDESLGGMAPFHSDAGASVKLRVREADIDEARAILEEDA